MYDMKESGKRIQRLRKEKGYTQETLAEAIGLSAATVASIETGRKGTSIDVLIIISEIMNCSIDYLVTGRRTVTDLTSLFERLPTEKKELAEKIFVGIIENI